MTAIPNKICTAFWSSKRKAKEIPPTQRNPNATEFLYVRLRTSAIARGLWPSIQIDVARHCVRLNLSLYAGFCTAAPASEKSTVRWPACFRNRRIRSFSPGTPRTPPLGGRRSPRSRSCCGSSRRRWTGCWGTGGRPGLHPPPRGPMLKTPVSPNFLTRRRGRPKRMRVPSPLTMPTPRPTKEGKLCRWRC